MGSIFKYNALSISFNVNCVIRDNGGWSNKTSHQIFIVISERYGKFDGL